MTSKPGLGVAQRTSTPVGENEMAAVPPVSANVRVVAGCGGAVDGGAVEDEAVEDEAVVGCADVVVAG